ncbi:amino acid ABC transporter permease [Aquirhabdus sp.]|uniref:amino acid ABC transporter permease n=1 Tax=Aquirhabdus sp. TaxID=2824160 RepID=UPI00396C6F1A
MSLKFLNWPASWGRQSKSSATIAIAIAILLLFLWLLAIPLAHIPSPIGENAQEFAKATRITVELAIIAGVIGVVLGVIAALGKLSRFRFIRLISGFYIWVIRGTPLLVQILFVYLALPIFIPSLQFSDFTSAAIALALNAGAYNAEAIRSGLLAVPKGQVEAAQSLGLSAWHTATDIVFPQAFKVALPPLVNNFIALLKDTSLAYAIGVVELTNVGNRIQAETFQPIPTLMTTAVIYLLLTTILTQISNAVERRFDVEGRQS